MNFDENKVSSEPFDLKSILKGYVKNWKWFVLSTVVFLAAAYVFKRYEIPEFEAEASVKVIESPGRSELNVFQDLEVFSGENATEVEEEIFILKSRSNLIEVADRLDLNLEVFLLGNIRDTEIYRPRPFTVNFAEPDSLVNTTSGKFYLRISDNLSFGYGTSPDGSFKPIQFGERFETPIGQTVITTNLPDLSNYAGRTYRVENSSLVNRAQKYYEKIDLYPDEQGSNVVRIKLKDPVLQKAKDVINTLVDVYIDNFIEERQLIANETSSFINERIDGIYTELASVDETEEDFKQSRRLTDIESQSGINLSESSAIEAQLRDAQIQLSIANSMKNRLQNSSGYEVMPSNIGIENEAINTTTAEYNALVSRRKRLLESSNQDNPVVRDVDQQLEALKRSMTASLSSMTDNLNLQTNSISQRLSEINSRLYSTPGNTRALRDINRKQETKEALYLYLMQKREEAQIAFKQAEPNLKIIDRAFALKNYPEGADPITLYLGALLAGLFIPFSVIYVKELLDTKIHNKLDLERIITGATIIGELPKLSKKESKLVVEDDRSVLAEAMRILRTNLYYVLSSGGKKSDKGKVVMITSSIANEGKTFLSTNLAYLLAKAKHKVLLVGADIRNPKIRVFLSENQKYRTQDSTTKPKGLTDFLHSAELKVKDIIKSDVINETHLDFVFSGKTPPNPTELLMGDRTGEFFQELAGEYDYIIVDTAPMLGVSDTLVLSKYADHIIYVARSGKTDKKVLNFPLKLKEEGRLKNLSFVVNGVAEDDLGYGGVYGYGYSPTKKKKWFRSN
ncbi:GumC family protein [Muriicola marianensis]|uniref:non-specific protein-tyrosine kinase n=1 Tax=Muriicola marianensis TaxID=1324801 RepID=A0ABQ1QQG2_9FLAO|nr:polysaccharide biosynthesis tyrosine autokinase [Muriicola marianensis]GGD40868.1 tyrosine protein kinase [Muriicola marianensis]